MNHQIALTSTDITVSLLTGFILCLIYFYLLWQTIGISRKSNHPGLILFISATLRIFLLIFISLVFSQNNVGRFLLIFCGFFLTRILLLKIAKPSFKKEIETNEIVYHTPSNSSSGTAKKNNKSTKKINASSTSTKRKKKAQK